MADADQPTNAKGADALNDRWIPRARVIMRRERAARQAERKDKSTDEGSGS